VIVVKVTPFAVRFFCTSHAASALPQACIIRNYSLPVSLEQFTVSTRNNIFTSLKLSLVLHNSVSNSPTGKSWKESLNQVEAAANQV
jgi:hypothetical protein